MEMYDKMQLWDAADKQQAEIEKLKKALRLAAGIISTYPPHTDKHPQDVYDWIIHEAVNETKG